MPFTKKTTVTAEAPLTVATHPREDLKVRQSQARKARTRLEAVNIQFDEAKSEHERVSQEAVTDERMDVTAISMCQQKIAGLEQAVKVATQQKDAADVAVAQAGERVQRDHLKKTLSRLVDTARTVEAWIDSGKPIIAAYHEARKEVLSLGYRDVATQINAANLSFQTYLFRSCAPMANCQTPYSAYQTDPKWSRPWSMSNPQPDLADTVKLS